MNRTTLGSPPSGLVGVRAAELEGLFRRWADFHEAIGEAVPPAVDQALYRVGAWLYRELQATYDREPSPLASPVPRTVLKVTELAPGQLVAFDSLTDAAPSPIYPTPFTCEAEARAAWGDR